MHYEEDPFLKNKTAKRIGKDKDDIFYLFGKIHGLENIVFVPEEKLSKISNPIELQMAVNDVEESRLQHKNIPSFDALLVDVMYSAQKYKEVVNKMDLYPSDQAKLLALPFFCQRRSQYPEPVKGTWQWELFTEIAGYPWDAFDHYDHDPEDKITEKDLPKGLREKIDLQDPEFKKKMRKMFLLTPTTYERHKEHQKYFKTLMKTISVMNEEEGLAYYHLCTNRANLVGSLVQNGNENYKSTSYANPRLNTYDYLDTIHGGALEKKFAEISEKDNYAKRNRHWLQKTKLNYLRPEKAPIDKAKIKDMFENSVEFRIKMNQDIGIYDTEPALIYNEKKIVQAFYKTAGGAMAMLRDEVGLKRDRQSLGFLRYSDFKKMEEKLAVDPVMNRHYMRIFNLTFFNYDVSDYFDQYAGIGEYTEKYQPKFDLKAIRLALPHVQYDYDYSQDYNLVEDNQPANYFHSIAEEERAEEEEDDEDEDEDEDSDVPVYKGHPIVDKRIPKNLNEEPEWPISKPKYSQLAYHGSPYFDQDEKIYEKYEDMELEGFMRLLNVQPFRNWQDKTRYQDRLGLVSPADLAQMVDPEQKMVGEVEREMFEKIIFAKHRDGTTVRFSVGDKKPMFSSRDA